jgi:hypothetical protein
VAADGDVGADLEVGPAQLVLDLLIALLSQPPLIPIKKKWSLAFRTDPEPY